MADPDALARTRRAYDRVARSYAALLPDTRAEGPLELAMVDELGRRVRASGRPTVLDAGCGAGRMSAYLARHGLEVVGVDVSPAMVDVAAATYPQHRFEVGDIAALPYQDGAFGGVLAWYSIIHTDPRALPGVVAELCRVLRPGGHLLVGFQSGSGRRHVAEAYGHVVDLVAELHSPGTVGSALRREGLRVVAELTRGAGAGERHPQSFLLAGRPVPT